TPDAIALLLVFIVEELFKEEEITILEMGSGMGMRHQVASSQEHTYAHHLLMEQGLKYLKSDGYAIFLAPSDLLTSPQSDLLKEWLKEEASLVAMISLPENLFANAKQSKTIFILQKKNEIAVEPFVYPLASLQDASV
ncbi:N-6 DNA methylase, partial [Streptococcus pneumoniae]|uniref:N-6 DNA methylase n=1 Tax=Streptococcus pneumoniae TaxID=1313 RepID=UPI000A8BB5B5